MKEQKGERVKQMALDIAIDLGTSRTRVYIPHKGIVINEPSVITVDLERDAIRAVGQEAYLMVGRTSQRLNAAYPLSGGVISDFGLVEAMIATLIRGKVSSRIGMPRAVACVPSNITEVEKRAVVNAISGLGVRKVCLIEEPVAAAMGAGLEISGPHGSFVVDIGGGTTDMAVISLSGTAVSRSIKQAGNVMDEELIKYVKRRYNLLIGKRTAETAKMAIGCVAPGVFSGKYRIKGRNLITGMPDWVDLDASETIEPLRETANAIVAQIQDILEETPPELIGDIYTDGIVLTGGSARIKGIDRLISAATDLKVTVAEDPDICVVLGCGKALKYIDRLNKPDRGGINPISDHY